MTPLSKESAGAEQTVGPTRRDDYTPDVAARAYEIFLSRGGEHGHDLDDWTQAERELRPASSETHEPLKESDHGGIR